MATIIIGGGGVGGAFSIGVLSKMSDFTKHRFIGSSVGSIIAAAYALGRRPSDVIFSFNLLVTEVFADPAISRLFGPLYDGKQLQKYLRAYFKDVLVTDVIDRLAVTAFNYKTGKAVIIKEGLLADALTASCAAPSFFEAYGPYVDGGLAANVPAILAKEHWPDENRALLIENGGVYHHDLSKWNVLAIPSLVEAMMAAQVDLAARAARMLYEDMHLVTADVRFPSLDSTTSVPSLYKTGVTHALETEDWLSSISERIESARDHRRKAEKGGAEQGAGPTTPPVPHSHADNQRQAGLELADHVLPEGRQPRTQRRARR